MKKQNVNNMLAFNKAAVTELNDNQLLDVNGGTSPAVPVVLAVAVAVHVGLPVLIAIAAIHD
jgi:lactobin A/cerein 7B family class IIb bacteriocin